MKVSYLLFLAWLLLSCMENNKTIVVDTFPQEDSLTAKVHKHSTPILLPRYMGVSGEYLYVYKERESKLFNLFKLPDLQPLGEMGERGQGPDDFNLLDTRSFKETENGFSVIEAGSSIWKQVTIEEHKLHTTQARAVLKGRIAGNGFYSLADSMFVTFGQINGGKEFSLYNLQKDSLCDVGEYPEWITLDDGNLPFFVYLKSCVSHPNGEKFAAFYSHFKKWRIYDNSLHLLRTVDVRLKPTFEDLSHSSDNELPTFYIGQPFATENEIYVLCSNSNKENKRMYELQVWKWDGTPIARYKLDRKISMMAISRKYNKIYAIDNLIEDEVYEYEFPIIK